MRPFLTLALIALPLAACGGGEDTTGTTAQAAVPEATEAADTSPPAESADSAAAEDAGSETVPAPEGSLAGEPMVIGAEDAPVTIVEYASTVCPACAFFHGQVLPEVKEKYIDTGLVRFEFREFPTNPKNLAYAGFYLARCAATERGAPAYFAILDTLFERQRDWAYGPTPGESLQNIAAQAGIDREGLEQCFNREDVKAAVKANVVRGIEEDDVRATPTLLVDGEEFDWGRSAETMMAAIDAELRERGVEVPAEDTEAQ